MVVNQPHFLLFTDAHLSQSRACAVSAQGFGRWHFVLERLDGPERLEAADSETDVHRDRLALLAVVRGLEALEQPSQVTLVTTSRYVSRGLRYGLNEWREAEYTWEHFGMQKPIRNADLWQRIDRAMSFHQVTCRLLQSPLAQAMVETATELDELTVLTNPLDAPFDVVADRAHESQTAAAVARRESATGLIQRVDSAHGSIGMAGMKKRKQLDVAGPSQIGTGHALVSVASVQAMDVAHAMDTKHPMDTAHLVDARPAAVLRAAIGLVHAQPFNGNSSLVPFAEPLTTGLSQTFRRPRISITLPNLHFRWVEIAMNWMRWCRMSLAEICFRIPWIRRKNGLNAWNQSLPTTPRSAMAPT